jgi:RNA polymerase sigma-70 factor (sigma-E family)
MGLGGVVDNVRHRDGEFDEFVHGAASRLARMAFALTGEQGASEDLLQDVLERVYVAWPRIDDPFAYARRALVNANVNRWRRRARHLEVRLTDAHDVSTADVAQGTVQRDQLVRAIAVLPARQRAVVVLRFLEDLSEADTARALSCSTGTVKSQTSRALAHLRTLLDDSDELRAIPTARRRS